MLWRIAITYKKQTIYKSFKSLYANITISDKMFHINCWKYVIQLTNDIQYVLAIEEEYSWPEEVEEFELSSTSNFGFGKLETSKEFTETKT